jgi:hypothetical protein
MAGFFCVLSNGLLSSILYERFEEVDIFISDNTLQRRLSGKLELQHQHE